MYVAIEHENGALVVRPRGDLDLATAPELERVLERLKGEHWAVVVDLSEVAFVDCAGIRPVRRALREPFLVSLSARTTPPHVQRVLDLTGLGRRPGHHLGAPEPM